MLRLTALLFSAALALAAPEDVVVLKAARMFDGKGDHVTSPGLVVVSGTKIVVAGARAAAFAGAQTIDLGDAILLRA
jgi:imidazolonepropionase-like amidohydrolase